MILTEAEAKTKRCQEGFAASEGVTDGESIYLQTMVSSPYISASIGSGGYSGIATAVTAATAPMHCIGSGCMAWVWALDAVGSQRTTEEGQMLGRCGKVSHQ